MGRINTRPALLSALVVALVATAVWAATEVTVTKTGSKFVNATEFVFGDYFISVNLQETSTGYFLIYLVYDYATASFVERGAGEIDSGDVSWTSTGVSLDTNTEDIAIIGDGGDIELEWTAAPGGAVSTASKVTTETDFSKTIVFGDVERTQVVAEGTVIGEDFAGTGQLRTTDSKVILQVK